jgi:hypothetical protein
MRHEKAGDYRRASSRDYMNHPAPILAEICTGIKASTREAGR